LAARALRKCVTYELKITYPQAEQTAAMIPGPTPYPSATFT